MNKVNYSLHGIRDLRVRVDSAGAVYVVMLVLVVGLFECTFEGGRLTRLAWLLVRCLFCIELMHCTMLDCVFDC